METQPKEALKPTRSHLRPIEIAQCTGLSKSFVMNEIWSGRLRGHRIGRAWLVSVEEFDRWIQGDGTIAA
ncbi:MAG: helix-turn-helix domain-containing protein [Thermomicrobiales bacterium]